MAESRDHIAPANVHRLRRPAVMTTEAVRAWAVGVIKTDVEAISPLAEERRKALSHQLMEFAFYADCSGVKLPAEFYEIMAYLLGIADYAPRKSRYHGIRKPEKFSEAMALDFAESERLDGKLAPASDIARKVGVDEGSIRKWRPVYFSHRPEFSD